MAALLSLAFAARASTLVTDHDTYLAGEDIIARFEGGPGNAKDWVGIYPADVTPGSQTSTLWYYGDGTKTGDTGLTEGTITFSGGLGVTGDWDAYLLLNDGYTILNTAAFHVVDVGTALVRPDQRTYAPGEKIVVNFSSGPGNAKDWVAVYKSGETPGGPPSTLWYYVDGTKDGVTGMTDGTLTFNEGLTAPGDYVAYFLLNDGYDILASESFSVVAPAGNQPRVLSLSPSDGSSNLPPVITIAALVTNGVSKVVPGSIVLKLDGQAVTPVIDATADRVTIRYTNSVLAASSSGHSYSLTFVDDATPANAFALSAAFSIASYENIILPAPLVFENFDATPEGQVPAGWTLKSFTEVTTTDFDLGNLDSASFANWTVVNADRFQSPFVTYSDPETTTLDYQRVLTPNPLNVVNGQALTGPLASGRLLFADSGYRNGASQVLYVFTPDFDLSGKTNIYVAFKSLYEQNQDSIGAVEYSVDGGGTWLPVAYFLDGPDILKTDTGAVDAVATFTTENSSSGEAIAIYTDPDTGEEKGGTYGAFIAAPISQDLAPFIQARVNDDPVESKRVERYRLPLADNQKTVRLRFAYAGSDSWYWGIDDFGLYSINSAAVPPPVLTAERTDAGLHLSWPADVTGYVLEGTSTLSQPNWTPVQGVTGNSVIVPLAGDGGYFQLRSP